MRVKKILPFFYTIFSFFIITNCKKVQVTQKPNVLLICVDDLRPELKSFGAKYISSPNIDALAEKGVKFQRHFVNSPSCGPSRYTLLTGQYGPAGNNALFRRANKINQGEEKVDKSMPEWFKEFGYTTVSVGKVSHHPGGRGGKNWNDSTKIEMPNAWDKHLMPVAEWEHPRGAMHGLANGQIRVKSGDMAIFETVEGDDNIYPDGAITNEALHQLKMLANKELGKVLICLL
jgi:iduronate 2-sulfatase